MNCCKSTGRSQQVTAHSGQCAICEGLSVKVFYSFSCNRNVFLLYTMRFNVMKTYVTIYEALCYLLYDSNIYFTGRVTDNSLSERTSVQCSSEIFLC